MALGLGWAGQNEIRVFWLRPLPREVVLLDSSVDSSVDLSVLEFLP